ncbi:MAG TPA: serine hydrolase [Acidimicrobiia bacterium]|nr:serine hydrolase [Acidimicrobiia bacterium]
MKRLLMLLLTLMLVTGCSDDGADTPSTTSTPDTTSVDSTPTTTPPTSAGPGTTVGEEAPLDTRLAWLAEVFNSGALEESEYQATFTQEFIDAVPYTDYLPIVQQISAAGRDWSVGDFESRDRNEATVLLDSADGQSVRAIITLEGEVPHRIAGLLLQPGEPPTLEDPPRDLDSAIARLEELASLELAVMEIEGGQCEPTVTAGSGEPAPVASAIKLYVLAAVAGAVEAGEFDWDTDVTISEDLKSIPTGVLQNEEEGATFSVREVAETMIAFSDNTGTDHLIDLVGRQAVEQAMADHGMEDPARNIPFLTTMELTALKLGPAAGLATQWLDADEEGRRAILEQISDITPADIPLAEFDRPIHPDTIEWFATPADMCRVLVDLWEMGEPVTQILTINPGLPDEEGNFESIAFKGGSEPGLVAMNWLVERTDGRRFVISGSLLDPEQPLDELEATLLFGAVRDLVADL